MRLPTGISGLSAREGAHLVTCSCIASHETEIAREDTAMDGETQAERDARIEALWEKLDTKKKGNVDLPALKAGLAGMNHPLKDADNLVRDMLMAADINDDGKISFDGPSLCCYGARNRVKADMCTKEFCKFCEQTEKELWTLFQSIDKDKNGRLDKFELASAFQRAGVDVSNARLDRFFQYIDKDRDGSIDYNEWRGMHGSYPSGLVSSTRLQSRPADSHSP